MVPVLQRTPRLVWNTDEFVDNTREYVKGRTKGKNECRKSEKSELVPL